MQSTGGLNFLRTGTVTLFATMLLPALVRAEIDFDPKSPLSWKEMLDCEQVIAAKYKGHKDDASDPGKLQRDEAAAKGRKKQTLTVEVVRVLKGPGKAGDTVVIALEHRYSVETGPTGFDYYFRGHEKVRADGAPKCCHANSASRALWKRSWRSRRT